MNNCFNHFNNEKKKATGKQHFHVMEAIRKMEPAWKKIAASNFRLGSYQDANGQMHKNLQKIEHKYVAAGDDGRSKDLS